MRYKNTYGKCKICRNNPKHCFVTVCSKIGYRIVPGTPKYNGLQSLLPFWTRPQNQTHPRRASTFGSSLAGSSFSAVSDACQTWYFWEIWEWVHSEAASLSTINYGKRETVLGKIAINLLILRYPIFRKLHVGIYITGISNGMSYDTNQQEMAT